jgi:hypothetical protein
MNKLNLLVHLNGYQDANPSNNPSHNNFKWNRDIQGININEPTSKSLTLASGQTVSLFSGAVATSDDGTTTWDISLKANTSQTYVISRASGMAPAFRAARTTGADATTEITITKNAKLMILTSTGGTALDLIAGNVVVGDDVRIGTAFNVLNRGKFKVLARTATSLTVENEAGTAEGPITLGASFADQIAICSAAGVQVGDKVDVKAGFSSVSFGTYEITDVTPNAIEIYSIESLPTESGVSNSPAAILIYSQAKSFVYVESDQKLEIKIDASSQPNELQPMRAGSAGVPGIFMSSASIKSLEITNKSLETATIFYVTAE